MFRWSKPEEERFCDRYHRQRLPIFPMPESMNGAKQRSSRMAARGQPPRDRQGKKI